MYYGECDKLRDSIDHHSSDLGSIKTSIRLHVRIAAAGTSAWGTVAEIPKKVRGLSKILGMEQELFPKSVPS